MENNTVLRVGVYNNFNFTEQELAAVRAHVDGTGYLPFVNSNSFVTITADYPSIITINPYLYSWCPPVGDISNIKACRIKWVVNPVKSVDEAQLDSLKWCLTNNIPILLTFMRFISKKSAAIYSAAGWDNFYKFNKGYYRLSSEAKHSEIEEIKEGITELGYDVSLLNVCDLSGDGCPACGNCAKLTYGNDSLEVHALSLSCSGDAGKCLFHCPDCWAKRLAAVANFTYDKVTQNSKQKGKNKND